MSCGYYYSTNSVYYEMQGSEMLRCWFDSTMSCLHLRMCNSTSIDSVSIVGS